MATSLLLPLPAKTRTKVKDLECASYRVTGRRGGGRVRGVIEERVDSRKRERRRCDETLAGMLIQ